MMQNWLGSNDSSKNGAKPDHDMDSSTLFLVSLVVRVTVLLTVGLLLVRLGRSLAASLRYKALLKAMVASLVLPAFMLLVPSWHVLPAVPDRWSLNPDPSSSFDRAAYGSESGIGNVTQPETRSADWWEADNPFSEALTFVVQTAASLSLIQLLAMIWLVGASIILIRSIHARWLLSRWWQQAEAADGSIWDDVLEEAGDRVFLTRDVSMKQMAGIKSPMTWGVWQPRLLMPLEADGWARERKLNAVMHEFVHVRRRDAWHDLVNVAFAAAFWFHPMTWMIRKQIRAEREASCDDAVLNLGANPQEYAQMLIDVAREMKGRRVLPDLAMTISRPSQLEGRILSVLDPSGTKRSSRPVAHRVVAVAWVVTVLLTSAMAPVSGSQSGKEWTGIGREVPVDGWDAVRDRTPSDEASTEVGDEMPLAAIEKALPDFDAAETQNAAASGDQVEDLLALAGIRMADAALGELGRTVSEFDWNGWLEDQGVRVSDLEFQLEDEVVNGASFNEAMVDLGSRIETAVIAELEAVIVGSPGTDKARRAIKALIDIDSPASRKALERLQIHRLQR